MSRIRSFGQLWEAEARRLFKRAIELDPEYAKPYALLAFAFCREWDSDMSGSDAALDQALALAKRAVDLDDGQETCLAALGFAHMYRCSFDLAEHYYTRALALNPNSPTVLANLAACMSVSENPQRAWIT